MESFELWKDSMGFSYFKRPEEDFLKIALDVSTNIDSFSPDEIDRAILVLSNYHNFLSFQLGELSAKVKFGYDKLNYNIDLIANKFNASNSSERRALAIANDENIQSYKDSLEKEEFKKNTLQPVVDSLKIKIFALQKIYERRIRSLNVN